MRTVTVCKADAIGVEHVEGVRIDITSDIPASERIVGPDWAADARRFYEGQARQIVAALLALPQGTRHSLVGMLLEQHANLFRGP